MSSEPPSVKEWENIGKILEPLGNILGFGERIEASPDFPSSFPPALPSPSSSSPLSLPPPPSSASPSLPPPPSVNVNFEFSHQQMYWAIGTAIAVAVINFFKRRNTQVSTSAPMAAPTAPTAAPADPTPVRVLHVNERKIVQFLLHSIMNGTLDLAHMAIGGSRLALFAYRAYIQHVAEAGNAILVPDVDRILQFIRVNHDQFMTDQQSVQSLEGDLIFKLTEPFLCYPAVGHLGVGLRGGGASDLHVVLFHPLSPSPACLDMAQGHLPIPLIMKINN